MAVITVNQIIDNIDSFISNVRNLSKSYYMVVGKPDPWIVGGLVDDESPPVANNSVQQTELSLYQDLVYGKLINDDDISFMIRKINWVQNTVYDQHDQDDPDLLDKDFYVVNDIGEVYKCINNGNGAPSTVKPFLSTESGTFLTGDGYIWKFIYKVDAAANTKFSSSNYIPVTINANVESNAVSGTIDYIDGINLGSNYQVYEEGFLEAVTNASVVILPDTSSTYSNYYTDSSMYLRAGAGAGQIRPITSYEAQSKTVTVSPPFNSYVNLRLAPGHTGSITPGNKVVQSLLKMSYLYDVGSFDVGDTVTQTDTNANGVITRSNSSILYVQQTPLSADFIQDSPIYNNADGFSARAATVTITNGGITATRITGTNLNTLFSVNDYIKVGGTAGAQIRRITAVAADTITIDADTPFTAALANVTITEPISAAKPVSITQLQREGLVVFTNLTGQKLAISNITPSGVIFIDGEKINLVDENNVNQGANAIMSFANTSTMFLTDADGTFTASLYALGLSSNVKAYINGVLSYPNITLENPHGNIGRFTSGQPISILTGAGTLVGNATVVSSVTTPNELTEYIISPTVTIDGDGTGALAYAHIDESGANPNRQITKIVTINPGEGYSRANVTFTTHPLYGSGATARVAISPILGHGANAYQELGARYAGISTTFGDGAAEGYKFPMYGDYRRIGILEDPEFDDAWVTVGSFDRTKLTLANKTGVNFQVGDIITQPASNAAGVISFANDQYMELKNVKSVFNSNSQILTLTVNTVSGTFSVADLIYQQSAGVNVAFGIILTTTPSTGVIKLSSVNGAFSTANGILTHPVAANATNVEKVEYNNTIKCLTTDATANIVTANVNYFRVVQDNQPVYELATNSSACLTQVVSNTLIRLSRIAGHFNSDDILIDPTTNSYANVVSITIANGTIDATSNFGHRFTQTTRLTMLTNTAPYTQFERVYQETSGASGLNMSSTSDVDLVLVSTNTTFSVGQLITENIGGGATAIVLWANNTYATNSSYLKCSRVNGNFDVGNYVINTSDTSLGGTIGAQYNALVVSDIYGKFEVDEDVIGAESEAQGNVSAILYPELTKNSGQLIYLDNIVPFTRSNTSVEKINIVIKF